MTPEERKIKSMKDGEITFEGDDKTYVQVSQIPLVNKSVFKIGLIEKGTPIDVLTDNRFFILIRK